MERLSNNEMLQLGEDCYLDIEQEVILKDGMERALSRTMFKILRYLAEHMGQEVTQHDLIQRGWGKNSTIQKDALYVVIKRIRDRLEDDPMNPQCLVSNYGAGYVLYSRQKKTKPKQIVKN